MRGFDQAGVRLAELVQLRLVVLAQLEDAEAKLVVAHEADGPLVPQDRHGLVDLGIEGVVAAVLAVVLG